MRDQLGRDIPEHLEHIFKVCETMDDFIMDFRRLQREVHQAAEACPDAWSYFNMAEFDRLIQDHIYALTVGRPYAVCPTCRGADANCRLFRGRGFLTKLAVKRAMKYRLWPGASDET
jgi:hypothetical protein